MTFSDRWIRILPILSLFLMVLAQASPASGKPRDALTFEDNHFLPIGGFELLQEYQRINRPEPRTMERDVYAFQVSYGLMTNYEVTARVPVYYFDGGERGLADVSLTQRAKFTETPESFVSSSGGLELLVPTGDDREDQPTGTEKLDARLFLVASTDLTTNVHGTGQIGYTYAGDDDIEDELELHLSFSYRVRNSLRTLLEVNLEEDGRQDERWVSVSPGLWSVLGRGLSAAVSVPIGVNDDAPETRIRGQLIHQF